MSDHQDLDGQGAIAVIGMACRFPGADTPELFWRNLCAGVQSVRRFSLEELAAKGVGKATREHPNYVPAFSGPQDVDKFDAAFFGMTPGEAECLDPQHRMLLECAHEALERAAVPFASARVGVFGGIGINNYLLEQLYWMLPDPFNLASGSFSRDMQIGLGNEKCYACTRISHKLNLKGPSIYVEAACATSLVAVHLACKSLLDYECDAAVAGGSKAEMPYEIGYMYEEGGMTSPAGEVRAFDADAKGTMFASGAGTVVLKRLEDARRDGDSIYAVIRGSAINNDGADKMGFTAPSFDGQRSVILEALAFAGISPDTISYVETHGTGTPLGDPIEVAALTAAYRTATARRGYCAIGSLKPNIGHMEAAAGIAGLIKAVLALHHRQLPASLNFERPNPEIDFAASPFYVNTQLSDWRSDNGPRRAGVSSFGVGGSNAHLILEEYVAAPAQRPSRPQQLLLWSAKTERALEAATERLAAHLAAHPEQDLADVAYTLQCGREAFGRRRMLVCADREAALAGLQTGSAAWVSGQVDGKPASVALLFPGQGAQHVDMAAAVYRHEPVFRGVLDDCAQRLQAHLGLDLRSVLYPAADQASAAAELLNQTWITQPALFAVSYALARQWEAWGVRADAMLGHSIGEYVAACLAGVYTLADALRLVALRGRLMQGLPAGEMLAVPLAESELAALGVDGWDLAAVNAPRACVLAGTTATIDALVAALQARGVEGRRLRTSHAFHSSMMDPILATYAQAVAATPRQAPTRRFVSNVTGDWILAEQALSADYWVRHLRGTVRFAAGVECLLAEPSMLLLETGPGQTLTTLARQQPAARGRNVVASLPHAREERDAQVALLGALGRLWLAQVEVDWSSFYADEHRRRVLLPTYPFERKRYWIDPPAGARGSRGSASDDLTEQAIADWFHVPGWTMLPLPPKSAPQPAGTLLFRDQGGLGAALATALRAQGTPVIEVDAGAGFDLRGGVYTVRPASGADYEQLCAQLAASGSFPTRIIHAWTADEIGADYARSQQLGFYSLLHLVQVLGARTEAETLRLIVLSRGLADVNGDEALDPLKATVLGPTKVTPLEYPHIRCRHVDIGAGVALTRVLAEVDADSEPGRAIALRGAHRWQSDYMPVHLEASAEHGLWREKGVYLITGGFGGLGLVFAERLARDYGARLVLIGRQSVPARQSWAATLDELGAAHPLCRRIRQLQAIEALGGVVLPIAADVTDADAMRAAVATAKAQFGALHGVMHAAGIAGGGIIARKSAAEAAAVLDPKIRGAQVLFEVLAGEALDFIVLHSSLFAVTGGAGQVDYCGANNALDLLARAHARRGTPVISLNWDGWTEVGMAARGAPGETRVQRPAQHPFLDGYTQTPAGDSEFVVELDPARHWVVDQHRMDGAAVLPGTGLLEMAVAGFHQIAGGRVPVELRDVLFLTPLAVAAGGTQARLLLSREGESLRFRVESRQGGEWRGHALGAIAAAGGLPGRCDLDELRRRHPTRIDFAGREAAVLPQDGWLQFGSRWHSVQRIDVGAAEALIELRLPAAHAADLDSLYLHPALLDLATGLANGYWLEQSSLLEAGSPFLPFGYQRITVWRPLPGHCYAHSRLCSEADADGQTLTLDVLLIDADGAMVASIEGFTLKRVQPAAVNAKSNAQPARRPGAAPGIAPSAGVDALDRILAYGGLPQMVVSTRPLRALIASMNAAPAVAAPNSEDRNERPDLGSAFAAPRNDLERALASIWESLLGMKQIGINDNFFELGGDSLLATQIPNRIRSELDVGIDLGLVFKGPTILQLAELIAARTWAAQRADHSDAAREVGTL